MRLRTAILFGVAASAGISALAATRIESSVRMVAPAEEKKVRDPAELKHPWTNDRPLPTSLAECGLESDAKLVVATLYLDGGSRLFALKDGRGAYFVFCTSKPLSRAKPDGEAGQDEHFVAGARHYSDPRGVGVPRGSPTEALLLQAISGRIVLTP